jgi:hypothetical protein
MASFTKIASGNISPARFVKLSTTALGQVTQCGAGDQIYGISQPGTHNVPYLGLDDGWAAQANEPLNIFGLGSKDVLLTLGGSVTKGDRLKSDANGQGVTTTSANDEVGAIAQANGVSGDMIPVQIVGPQRY